jgi:ribosomal-protein-alanine N-acetyltransferase
VLVEKGTLDFSSFPQIQLIAGRNTLKEELLTDRLRLVPIATQDSDAVFSLLRNPKIKKYLCDNKDIEKEFAEGIIDSSETLFTEKGIGLCLIRESATHSMVGFCGFFKNDLLELIYVVHPDFQSNGYATEACLRSIEYFNQLKLSDDVFAKIDLPNIESHVVAHKIGMRKIRMEKNPITGGDMKIYKLQLGKNLNFKRN